MKDARLCQYLSLIWKHASTAVGSVYLVHTHNVRNNIYVLLLYNKASEPHIKALIFTPSGRVLYPLEAHL